MPNWIEGTLKVRGLYENVKRFFTDGLNVYDFRLDKEKGPISEARPKESWMEIEEWSDETEIVLFNGAEPHIEGTRRAFLEAQTIYILSGAKGQGYACAKVKQAWAFVEENWQELSKKYGVDFRLYGFEMGMQFCQELEIIQGEVTIDNEIKYDDWDWECPMPNLGG